MLEIYIKPRQKSGAYQPLTKYVIDPHQSSQGTINEQDTILIQYFKGKGLSEVMPIATKTVTGKTLKGPIVNIALVNENGKKAIKIVS